MRRNRSIPNMTVVRCLASPNRVQASSYIWEGPENSYAYASDDRKKCLRPSYVLLYSANGY